MGKRSRNKRQARAATTTNQATSDPSQERATPTAPGDTPNTEGQAQKRRKKRAPTDARASQKPQRSPTAGYDGFHLLDELPAIGLGALAAILPVVVKVGLRDLFQLPKTFAMTYGAAWLLALVAIAAIAGRPLRWNRTPLKWPLIGLALSIAIGVGLAPAETGGILSIFAKMDAYRWSSALLIFALGLLTVQRPRHLTYILGGMTIGGLLVAIYGIAQHHNIRALLPEDAHRWVAINAPGSTFGNRNMAAQLIVSVMPATYVALAMGLRWWHQGKTRRALTIAGTSTAILVALLYYLRLSVTRSAWGGAILGVLVIGTIAAVGFWRGRRDQQSAPTQEKTAASPSAPINRRRVWPIALGLLAAGALVLVFASSTLNSFGYKAKYDSGLGDEKRKASVIELLSTITDFKGEHWDLRFMMWETTWEAIKAKPFGGGAGNWRVLFPQYVVKRTNNKHFTIARQPVRAHEDFLQFWSEYGVQGFASLIALLLIAGWMGSRVVQRWWRPDLRERDDVAWMALAALAGVGGLVAIAGDALLSFPLQLPAPTFFFAVHLAVVGASWSYVRRVSDPELLSKPELLSAPKPLSRGVRPSPPSVHPALKFALVVAALTSVVFVHHTNDRLLKAEWGFTRARSLQKRGHPVQALAEIKKAIAINPEDFQNHFIEALCYNSMRKMPSALDSIERSLALYPNLLNAWVNMALFARKAGNEPKMLKAIKMALALKKDETYVLDLKADYLMRRGEPEKIPPLYKPYLAQWNANSSMPNRNYLNRLARAYEKTRQWSKRGEIFEMKIKYYKLRDYLRGGKANTVRNRRRMKMQHDRFLRDRLSWWQEAGRCYRLAHQYDKEVKVLQKAASWVGNRPGPHHGEIKRRYAVAQARVGHWDKAYHELGVALNLDPNQKTALLQDLGAMKLQAKGDHAKQVQVLIDRAHAW